MPTGQNLKYTVSTTAIIAIFATLNNILTGFKKIYGLYVKFGAGCILRWLCLYCVASLRQGHKSVKYHINEVGCKIPCSDCIDSILVKG